MGSALPLYLGRLFLRMVLLTCLTWWAAVILGYGVRLFILTLRG